MFRCMRSVGEVIKMFLAYAHKTSAYTCFDLRLQNNAYKRIQSHTHVHAYKRTHRGTRIRIQDSYSPLQMLQNCAELLLP